MNESFENQDMSRSVYINVKMERASFLNVNLKNARFEDVSLANALIINADLGGLTIEDADIRGMTIYGLRIDKLITAEQDRLDPERVRLRMGDSFDPDCVKDVINRLDVLRQEFTQLLQKAPPEFLRTRPAKKEWSILEILRHLVFAEDLYIHRWILRDSEPWCEFGLTPAFINKDPAFSDVGSRTDADLETILAAWMKIHRYTTSFLRVVTREALQTSTSDVDFGQGTVGQVLQTLASHDLMHMRCAERWIHAQLKRSKVCKK